MRKVCLIVSALLLGAAAVCGVVIYKKKRGFYC